MRIGIFGGTFDPVHNEHVRMAVMAKKELSLDRLFIVPAYVSPFKKGERVTPAKHRLAMAKLAFEDYGKDFIVSDYEIEKGGASYSFETVEHFKKFYPSDDLFFIIGGDSLSTFRRWRNPERITKSADIAVIARKSDYTDYAAEEKAFKRTFGKGFIRLSFEGSTLSASKIRLYAGFSLPIADFVPPKVADYIAEHGLYRYNPYAEYLSEKLTPARLTHTVGVITAALYKAKEMGLDPEKVLTAATLHDVAKYVDPDTVEGFVYKGIPKQVVHAYLGAYLMENELGITDKDVLDAVRYHTSGKAAMSDLGKLLFTADMIEDGRTYDGVERLRELYYTRPIDEAFTECLKEEIAHIRAKGYEPFTETMNAYNYYVTGKGISRKKT